MTRLVPSTRPGESLWQATAAPGAVTPPLTGVADTDVLVAGGGVAGLSTAVALAERGVATVLLEAGEIGMGATGQSGGLIAPDFIRHTPETIGDALGRAAGERLTQFIGASGAETFAMIDRLGIECDLRRDGFWTPAHSGALAEQQRANAAQWASRGFRVRFVGPAEVQAHLSTGRYEGALRFDDAGSLNPLALARGLARAASQRGVAVHTGSRIASLSRENGKWVARTDRGTVRARRLVLAANGGNPALHPALARTILPLPVVEFATAPLTPAHRAAVLPEGGGFTDKTSFVSTARYDGQGHLVSGYPGSLMIRSDRAMRREASRRLAWIFPHLADVEIRFAWRGTAWVNPSLLPQLYALGDDAIAIQACNGRGLSTNVMLGDAVGRWLAGASEAVLPIAPTAPRPIRFHPLARWLPVALMSVSQIGSRFR